MSNEISNQNPTDATPTSTTGEETAVVTPALEPAPSTAMAAAWANRKPLKEKRAQQGSGAKPAGATKAAPVAADVTPTETAQAPTDGVLCDQDPANTAGTAVVEPKPVDTEAAASESGASGELLCDQSAAYTGGAPVTEPVTPAVTEPETREASTGAQSTTVPAAGAVVTGTVVTKLFKQEEPRQLFGVLIALAGGLKGLLHESQLNGATREDRAARLKALKKGEEVTVKVIEVKPDPKKAGRVRISLSEQALTQDRLSEGLEGTTVEGVISGKAITHVFVSLPNGLRGLLHVTELNGNRNERDARLAGLQAGETVTVKVLAVKEDAKRPGKTNVSLSERAATYDRLITDLRGATVNGTVTGFLFSKENKEERIGAFVEIGNGLRGLVHVSQLAGDGRREHDDRLKVLEVGETMTVQVIEVSPDPKRQGDLRIALSEQGPARRAYLEELKGDSDRVFKAAVVGREERGFKVQLSHGVVGILSFDELGGVPAETVKRGNNVRVKLLSVDGDQVRLTRRGL